MLHTQKKPLTWFWDISDIHRYSFFVHVYISFIIGDLIDFKKKLFAIGRKEIDVYRFCTRLIFDLVYLSGFNLSYYDSFFINIQLLFLLYIFIIHNKDLY